MNNNHQNIMERRVRQQQQHHQQQQQKRPSQLSSSSLPTIPVSPPLSPLDDSRQRTAVGSDNGEEPSGKTTLTTGAADRRRNTWAESAKRKLTARSATAEGPTATDPFAGMKTCINYQQEIERLKTLVPKVEIKKRPLSSSSSSSVSSVTSLRPNSTASPSSAAGAVQETIATSPTLNVISTTPPSSSSSQVSSTSASSSTSSLSSHDSASSISSPTLTTVINKSSDGDVIDNSLSAVAAATTTISLNDESPPSPHITHDDPSHQPSSSVITDEEKARFLEFMRTWTGGLNGWNGQPIAQQKPWLWDQQQSRRSQLPTRSEPVTPIQETHPDFWYQQQQLHHHKPPHPHTQMDLANDLNQPSPPPPLALPSYQQQPLYFASMHPQRQQQTFLHQQLPHSHNYTYQLHQQQQRQRQQQLVSSSAMEWHGNLGTPSSTQIGTIGDRHRSTRHPGPFGVSVM